VSRALAIPSPQTYCAYPALPAPVTVRLVTLEEHACGYFPERRATTRAFLTGRIDGSLYHRFMDAGFRRSGRMIYQPVCRGCRLCTPIRVPVERFAPSRSQRRTWRRNRDVHVEVAPPEPSAEKLALYQRYQRGRHDPGDEPAWESFVEFLYDSPVDTVEFTYRDAGGALLGVGLCDVCPESLSSVYFYFDPCQRTRSLGTFSSLWEIEFARAHRIPHYYLGYHITGCAAMAYKAHFRPHELLHMDGQWRETSAAWMVEKLR
jgi:arginine-tRNA-protein transferase